MSRFKFDMSGASMRRRRIHHPHDPRVALAANDAWLSWTTIGAALVVASVVFFVVWTA